SCGCESPRRELRRCVANRSGSPSKLKCRARAKNTRLESSVAATTPRSRILRTFAHLRAIVFDQMIPRIAHYWRRETVETLMSRAGLDFETSADARFSTA